ncbi:hypothetical protein QBC34DRAFT_421192 [Podospora aff. communis PSN243]|uniref:2EXR domain-containing protein n=1 Tax=Podospora aff. communis PSN243 TaxID=3040156 RepID=A0AAV9H0P8_9PEZI|nr:hypothetical protein QBC34DRAFT_421192 [Podospora aff. communis PSN243]
MPPRKKKPARVASLTPQVGFNSLPQEIRDMIWQCVLDHDEENAAEEPHERDQTPNPDYPHYRSPTDVLFGYPRCGTSMWSEPRGKNLIARDTHILTRLCQESRNFFLNHSGSQCRVLAAPFFRSYAQLYKPSTSKRNPLPLQGEPQLDPWPACFAKKQRVVIPHDMFSLLDKRPEHRAALEYVDGDGKVGKMCPQCEFVESFVASARDGQTVVVHPEDVFWQLDGALGPEGSMYRAAGKSVRDILRFWLGDGVQPLTPGERGRYRPDFLRDPAQWAPGETLQSLAQRRMYRGESREARFLLDLDDDIALEEWRTILEAGDPARMPDLLPSLVYGPGVRDEMKEEALNHVRSAWRLANIHRRRRLLRPLAELPEMRVALEITLYMDEEGHYIEGQ